MKAKKRWTSSIRTESDDLIEQIHCDSSSSEECETEEKNPKKFKAGFPNFEDVNLTGMNPIQINEGQEEITPIQEENIPVTDSSSTQTSSFKSDECIINFGEESPILTTKLVYSDIPSSDSPVISQGYSFREGSPVLTGRKIIKNIKRRKKEIIERSCKIDGSSPDILFSQKSRIIEDNDSPDYAIKTTNCSQEMASIELISSQDSSSLNIINPSISDSSIPSINPSNDCYHQPSPRRKNCSKNGLFSQLQKSLNLKKSRISLWHHDIFCKNVILSDLEYIEGIICDKWRDFGCTVLKCLEINIANSGPTNMFLISLGSNTDLNLALSINLIIKIYPPFREKFVKFDNRETKLFYNVSRVLTETSNDSIT